MYTVGDIKRLTGISARTLQYYDEISLLKPSKITNSKYRLYDDQALEKLQQIMFFKELGFQLAEIKQIMDTPNFDKISAYRKQKELLLLKRNRMDGLIKLLDKLEKGEQCMSFKEFDLSDYIHALEQFKINNKEEVVKYWGSLESFDEFIQRIKEDEETVAKLAIQSHGSVEKYTEEMKKNLENFSEIMSSKITPEFEKIGAERERIFLKLVQDITEDYRSEEVQNSVRELIEFAAQNAGNDMQEDMVTAFIDIYTSAYFMRRTDKQYGEGTSAYVVKAFRYYKESEKHLL